MRLPPRGKAILTGAALPLLATGILWWRGQTPREPAASPVPRTVSAARELLIQKPELSPPSSALLKACGPTGGLKSYPASADGTAAAMRLNELPADELQAACQQLRPLVREDDPAAITRIRALLVRWASLAPAEAFAWALWAAAAHPPPDGWSRWQPMIKDCASTWASSDAAGLSAWWSKTGGALPAAAARVDERDTFGIIITDSLAEWIARANPVEAVRYFAATPDRHDGDGNGHIMNFGETSPGAGLRTAEEASTALDLLLACAPTHEAWREPARDIFAAWAKFDADSLENRLPSLTDKTLQERAAEQLLRHRLGASPDPAATADAWLANPRGLPAERTLAVIVEAWSLKELNAAGEWLNRRPHTPERWDAIEQFSRRAFFSDPQAAFTWLAAIEDPIERQRRTARLFDTWERTDPPRAAAFAQASGWDAEQMQWIEELRAVR